MKRTDNECSCWGWKVKEAEEAQRKEIIGRKIYMVQVKTCLISETVKKRVHDVV